MKLTSQQLNLIFGISIVVALIGAGAANVVVLWQTGAFSGQLNSIILTLMAFLQSFRHIVDVVNKNGSSGTDAKQTDPTKEG